MSHDAGTLDLTPSSSSPHTLAAEERGRGDIRDFSLTPIPSSFDFPMNRSAPRQLYPSLHIRSTFKTDIIYRQLQRLLLLYMSAVLGFELWVCTHIFLVPRLIQHHNMFCVSFGQSWDMECVETKTLLNHQLTYKGVEATG